MSTFSHELKSVFATLPRTERGRAIVINGDPKGKNFLYTNGNSIIIRNIENPAICDIYTEHSSPTTCARYSPSGFYIASADQSGKVRIWDTTQKEHILKNEFQPFVGTVKDLSWTSDSKRIAVCGEGREKFGHVFHADTGTSVGEIMGHSKVINSIDFKSTRPFRMATGSDDCLVGFFHGPPFKFQFTKKEHTRFVNAVRYAPDGTVFISGGADGNAIIYDGTSGEKVNELGGGSPAHKGGIYALSFSPDSKQVLTASGDKTCKIWDVETTTVVTEFKMGNAVEDMQVGCLWQDDYLLSVSLSGHINYLDKNKPDKPLQILKGHNKPITALAAGEDGKTLYTAASDGQICYWNSDTGASEMFPGKGHTNQVQDMVAQDDNLVTIGMDDTLMVNSIKDKTYGVPQKMPSQPRAVAVAPGGLTVVACYKEIVVLRGSDIVFTEKVMYEPLSCAINPNMAEVAIGGNDNHVYLYTLSSDRGSDTLSPSQTFDHTGAVLDLAYSRDGSLLAGCDSNRKVVLYEVPSYKLLVKSDWSHHTARVNTADWNHEGKLATGSLDTNINIWEPNSMHPKAQIKGAHLMSQITRVRWLNDNTLISVGQDSNVKQWTIKYA